MASAQPIRALIPPPLARDVRVGALLEAFERVLEATTDRALLMLDSETCPESVLPYLVYEHSLDEFIGPGLPTSVIRTMIARAWELHEPKGYAEGVEGGVAMLGYAATLIQWWQETPQARRGTHRIEVPIDKPLWPDKPLESAATVRAVWRMIHAMQRWSQDHALQIVAEAPVATRAGAAVLASIVVQIEPFDPGIPEVPATPRAAAGIVLGRQIIVSGWME